MEKRTIATIDTLQDFLQSNSYWANGKNFSLDHLHATGANSRWKYENVYGIYLTNPRHAWMAAWMAVTDRTKVRKRCITYHRPSLNDHLGHVSVCSSDRNILRDEDAFLYLVEPERYKKHELIDVSSLPNAGKIDHLMHNGFVEKTWTKNSILQTNYAAVSPEPMIVNIDSWQLALVNIERIVPDYEIAISQRVIDEMRKRVTLSSRESAEEYIQY